MTLIDASVLELFTDRQKEQLKKLLEEGYTYDGDLTSFFGQPTMTKGHIYFIFDLDNDDVIKASYLRDIPEQSIFKSHLERIAEAHNSIA